MKRKSLLFLVLIALFAPLALNAQSTYSWGSSTTNSGYDNNANPFGRYYGYEYRVYLYPPNTMPFAGNITQLEFLPNGTLAAGGQIDVWMKTTTTITSLDISNSFATYKSGATQVYTSSSSPAFTTGTYVAIPLSTPIAYNYANNEYLMILVRSVANSNSGDGGKSFFYYNPTNASNNTWWAKNDYSDPGESAAPSNFGAKGTGTYLPVVRFTYTGTAVPTISLSPSSATVFTGFTTTLTATCGNVSGTPTITYSSSNTNVATVTGSGTTATVTGVAPGTATITATMNGSYTATSNIIVENPSYCTPAPTSIDGSGITNVTFGTGSVVNDNLTMNSSPYYYDHSNMIGGAVPGSTVNMSIAYATNYTYYTWVWVDWNKDYVFDDTDLVYPSTQTISSGTLSIQFNVPSSVTSGDYRMRIQGADNSSKKNPCYTGSYSYLVDYTLRVSSDPTISLTPATATLLAGSTETITATVANVSGTPSISYSSSNTSVATVTGSGTTATVTGVSVGTATITATMTVNGTPYTATCTVNVADLTTCQGFETDLGFWTVTTDNANYTWRRRAGTGGGSYSSAGSGSYNVGVYYGGTLNSYTYLTLNADLSSYTDKTISFMYINPNWSSDTDYLYLQYTTDGTTYTDLVSYTAEGITSWTQVTNLAIPDAAKYIRFAAYSNYGYGVGLDEICLDYSTSSCPKPTDLVVSDITPYSARLAWTPGDSETSWEYLCIAHGDTPDWTSQNVITSYTHSNVPANILAGTGQDPQPETEYDFYVRAVCGGGDYSNPAMISFTTLSLCAVPTNPNTTNILATSATLNWTGYQTDYNVQYTKGFAFDFESTEPWSYQNFAPCTTYDGDGISTYAFNTWNFPNQEYVGACIAFNNDNYGADFMYAHSGNAFGVMFNPKSSTVQADDWFILPELTIDSGYVFSFWGREITDQYGDETINVGVYGSTDGTFSSYLAQNVAVSSTTWTPFNYSLSDYVGQTIRLAINCTSLDIFGFMLDDIFVGDTNWRNPIPCTGNSYTLALESVNDYMYPETDYVWRVQGVNCDGNNTNTDWSAVFNFTSLEGYTKDILGYGNINNAGGYYLIASPIGSVDLDDVTNLLANEYDLYYFDQAAPDGLEWINHLVDNNFTNLEPGKGYLYANINNVTLVFTDSANTADSTFTLHKTSGAEFEGWNLVGNPFAEAAYIVGNPGFYTMNSDGSKIIAVTGGSIEAMEGVFVKAQYDGEPITFTRKEPAKAATLSLNLDQDNSLVDRAIIRFDEGRQLPKFQLNDNSTKVYIPQDGNDYAVTSSEEVGEMPVNFMPESNGNFTLSYDVTNVEFAYLHLIDNITGKEVDLLETPSYSFVGKTTDPANRFKLVYATGTLSVSENFAFFNNGSFVINNEGDATVQVIDINGRIVKSESINGNANVNVNAAAGVYMIRLINGENVMVQKVVVR